MKDLDLDVGSIGPGLYFQRALGRIAPLADMLSLAAKIIGKINLGDNSVVGLNSVVITNGEPNVTVFGVPDTDISRSAG